MVETKSFVILRMKCKYLQFSCAFLLEICAFKFQNLQISLITSVQPQFIRFFKIKNEHFSNKKPQQKNQNDHKS